MKKVYLILDSRAIDEIGDYTVFECCDSLKEAKKNAPGYGDGCCIWSCDVKPNNENAGDLINEQFVIKL